jgi:hypothetical protein
MIINDLYNNKKFIAEAELNPGEDKYYYRVRQQSKRDIELEMPPKLWDSVGPEYATYEEAQAAFKALQAKYPNEKFTYTQHPRISNMGGKPHRVFPPGVAEGQLALNTPNPVVVVTDTKTGKILDTINLNIAAQKYRLGNPQNVKNQLAHQSYTTIGNYTVSAPMGGQPQDKTTTGQKNTFATGMAEASLGDYRKKAALSKATSQIDRFFGRDDPAKVAQADQTIAKREKGLGRADARAKAYTPPTAAPADLEKQQRDLTAKYPNIDELVRRAELNRDPDYEMADGQAYYAARDAEQNYQKLKQIQRVIQGLNESLNRSHLP